jgi:hypothetical protein
MILTMGSKNIFGGIDRMESREYNRGNNSAVEHDATTRHTQEAHRGGSAADCTKKSADVAQGVSESSRKPAETQASKPRKVNPHAAVRRARRERMQRYKAALEAIRESLFQAETAHLPAELFDCVSPSVTREERLFISQECGVTSLEDGDGWFAYQQKTPRPRVLSHSSSAAEALARAEAEQKRQAEARNRELGYGKKHVTATKGGK